MPDSERTPARTPATWSEAFAALPAPAPPADGWASIAVALEAQSQPGVRASRRRRWPLWLAAAAAVATLAVVPGLRQRPPPGPAMPAAAPALASVQPAAPATVAATLGDRPRTETGASTTPTDATRSAHAAAAAFDAPATADASRPARATAQGPTPAAPSPAAQRVSSPSPTRTARVATAPMRSAASAAASAAIRPSPGVADARPANREAIARLQAESARLEALVALARDDAAASASGLVMSAGLGARVGAIDSALSQPGLDDADRAALWHQRVAALRELAGIETTQRWLAAQGERYDGALVRVD